MRTYLQQRQRLALVVMLCGLLLSNSGCPLLLLGAGAAGGVAGAAYVQGKLEAEVNGSVPKVRQAAVGSLKELDLPIREEQGDQLSAVVKSKTADGKAITINVESLAKNRAKVSIRVGLIGDEIRSRRILSGIERRL